MKYILITLLSFTFATQITTREFEIEIPIQGTNEDFFTNIDLLDESNISLEHGIFKLLSLTPIFENGGLEDTDAEISISFIDLDSDNNECRLDFRPYNNDVLNCEFIFYESMSQMSITGYYSGGNALSMVKLKYWLSGQFDDEDSSMGDMNNDGSLNVYDVLILVGIILDGDSGDIFDVMEIIKRV